MAPMASTSTAAVIPNAMPTLLPFSSFPFTVVSLKVFEISVLLLAVALLPDVSPSAGLFLWSSFAMSGVAVALLVLSVSLLSSLSFDLSSLVVVASGVNNGSGVSLVVVGVNVVLFQHTHSIQMQKVRRRRAHTRHTPQGGGGGGGDLGSRTRSYSSASKQVLSPAQEVRIPAAAKGVEKMLSDRRFDSPLRVTLFSGNSDTLAEGGGGAGAGGGGGDGAEDPETVLVNLERRRQQLLSELSRKRKLLAQYEEERAAFGAPASELKLELPAVSGAGT